MWTGWPRPSSRAGSPRSPALTTRLPAGPCLSTSHSRSLCPNLAGAGVGRGPWRGAALWLHVTVAAKVSPAHKCGPRWAAAELQAQRVLHRSSGSEVSTAPPGSESSPSSSGLRVLHLPPRLTRLTGYPTPAAQEAGPQVRRGPSPASGNSALPWLCPPRSHRILVPTRPRSRLLPLPGTRPSPRTGHLLVLKSLPSAELPAEPPAVPFSYAYTSLRVWPKEV